MAEEAAPPALGQSRGTIRGATVTLPGNVDVPPDPKRTGVRAGSDTLTCICNSCNTGTKTVVPDVVTAPHSSVKTPIPLVDNHLAGPREASATWRG